MSTIPATIGRALRTAAVLAGITLLGPVHGSNLQVSPVKVDMPAGQRSTGITLRNPGRTPIYGQVRVFAWDQAQGVDSLRPATDLIASPPLLTLDVDGVQLVRLVRTSLGESSRESSYRLLVDEIADPDMTPENGVAIQLRYSIPLFIASHEPARPHPPVWTLSRRDNRWMLRLDNAGRVHLQVGALTLVDAKGVRMPVADGLLGYALAQRYREWRLPQSVASSLSSPVHVEALINGRPDTTVATIR